MELKNNIKKYAIVTGASKGVGFITAQTLAKSGYHVIAIARSLDLLKRLESEDIEVYQLDMTDFDAIEKFYQKYQDITLDLLVNNAGGAYGHNLLENENPKEFNHAYNLNVTGPMYISKLFLPNLKKSKNPTIIFISSMAGKFVYRSGGSYVISKRALRALVELMRLEFWSYGIKITEICPGSINTIEDQERPDALKPEDLANTILWVASLDPEANINHIEITPLKSRRY